MFFYFLIFSCAILFNLRVPKSLEFGLENRNISLSILSLILITFVFGFRYGFGIDYFSYIEIYDRIGNNWSQEFLEPGFYYLNIITKELNLSVYFIFFISFFVSFYFISITINRYSEFPELSILILFASGLIFFFTSGIRQSIAISICFYSFVHFLDRNLMKFSLFLLLALSFHLSAIIFFPFYFIVRLKPKRFVLLILFIVSFVLVLFPNLIVGLLENFVNLIFGDRYSKVITSLIEANSRDMGLGLKAIFMNISLLFVIIFYKKLVADNIGLILTNFFIVGQLSNNIFGGLPDINRLSFYFSIFDTLFFPYLISRFKNFDFRLTLYVIYFGFFLLLMVRYIHSDVYHAIPYRSIFD